MFGVHKFKRPPPPPPTYVTKTIAQEAPRFLLFYQKSDRVPNYVQALFLALAFNFFLKRPARNVSIGFFKLTVVLQLL